MIFLPTYRILLQRSYLRGFFCRISCLELFSSVFKKHFWRSLQWSLDFTVSIELGESAFVLERNLNRFTQVPSSYNDDIMSILKVNLDWMEAFESSCSSIFQEVFLLIGVPKICSKFTEEHPFGSVISIKLEINFIEITLPHGCSL